LQILGVGALGGIGFTVSIFIAGLVFADQPELAIAMGIFGGSLLAGGTGFLFGARQPQDGMTARFSLY